MKCNQKLSIRGQSPRGLELCSSSKMPDVKEKPPNKRNLTPPASPGSSPAAKKTAIQNEVKNNPSLQTGLSPQNSSAQSNIQNDVSPMHVDMINTELLFPDSYTGNLDVIVESQDKNIGNLHPFALSKMLSVASNSIQEIVGMGRNKVKIIFKNIIGANSFLLNADFQKKNQLKAYVAQSLLFRFGVVKNIPTDTTIEELQQSIVSSVKVHSIRRLQKKAENKLIPIPVIEVKFFGSTLPDFVFFYNLRCRVEPSIRNPIQCFNCLRFNHTATQCRGQVRCSKCGENHKVEDCTVQTSEYKCAQCQGNHQATDRICPSYIQQRQIKRIMAFENLSYRDAKLHQKNKFVSKAHTFAEISSSSSPNIPPPLLEKEFTQHKGTKFISRNWPTIQKNQYPTLSPQEKATDEYVAVYRAQEQAKASSQPDSFQAELRIARAIAAIKAVIPDKHPDLKLDSNINDIVEQVMLSILNNLPSQITSNPKPPPPPPPLGDLITMRDD